MLNYKVTSHHVYNHLYFTLVYINGLFSDFFTSWWFKADVFAQGCF